jgi:hypothetical protein
MEALHSGRAAQISKHVLKDIEDMVHPNAAALLRWDDSARQFIRECIATRLSALGLFDDAQIFFDHVKAEDLKIGMEWVTLRMEDPEKGERFCREETAHPRILFINQGMVRMHNDQFPISLAVPKGRRDRMTVVSAAPVSLNGRMLDAEDTIWTDGPGAIKTIAEVGDPSLEMIRRKTRKGVRRNYFVNRGVIYWESFREPHSMEIQH